MDRRRFMQAAGLAALSTAAAAPLASAADKQSGWRRCKKCEGLFFGWNSRMCPAGANHTQDDESVYILTANDPKNPGQQKWRSCGKCQGLWYGGGDAKGKCPVGGEHNDIGSWDYVLQANGKGQMEWYRCNKCQGLFYAGGASAGICPAGGEHAKAEGSGYTLEYQRYKRSVTGKAVAGFEVLDAIMEKYLKKIGCSAAALTVARSHQAGPQGMRPTADQVPLYSRGYGWCDRDQTVPMQPDAVIDIGSCTKSFSAAAVRQLALDGKLDLNASVLKLLKIEPKGKVIDNRVWDITINHLLDMKSGWIGEPLARANAAAGSPVMSYYDLPLYMLRHVMVQNLRDAPGQKFEYDNLAYHVLEAIVHRLSGVGHPEYIRSRLCRPFGVNELSTTRPAARVWNAYAEGTTSPPWVGKLAGGHANLNYSAPVMCTLMRYFWNDGRPRDNGGPHGARAGHFTTSTAMMFWRDDGIDFAFAFNGWSDVKHGDIEKELNQALDKLIKNKKLPPLPKSPVNLLVNPSFDLGPRVGDIMSLNAGSTAIRGWRVTRGQIDLVGSYCRAQNGRLSLDLHGSPGYGGIEQTFKTTVGQRYRVTFAMAGNPGGKVAIKRLAVGAAGKEQEFAFDSTNRKADNMGWIEYAWEFEAVAERTTLEFHSVMNSDPYFGPELDNVRVWTVLAKK